MGKQNHKHFHLPNQGFLKHENTGGKIPGASTGTLPQHPTPNSPRHPEITSGLSRFAAWRLNHEPNTCRALEHA